MKEPRPPLASPPRATRKIHIQLTSSVSRYVAPRFTEKEHCAAVKYTCIPADDKENREAMGRQVDREDVEQVQDFVRRTPTDHKLTAMMALHYKKEKALRLAMSR